MNDSQFDLTDIALISLSKENEELLANNPIAIGQLIGDTAKGIALNSWPLIMIAQVTKAMKGDTTSAKFISDFIDSHIDLNANDSHSKGDEWESLSIQLRDTLQLEISAENLIVLVLKKLIYSEELRREILK